MSTVWTSSPRLRRRGLRRLHQMSAELHSLRTACFYHLMNTRLHSPFTPCFHHRLRCSIAGTDASSLGFIEKQSSEKQRTKHNTAKQSTPPQNKSWPYYRIFSNQIRNQHVIAHHVSQLMVKFLNFVTGSLSSQFLLCGADLISRPAYHYSAARIASPFTKLRNS